MIETATSAAAACFRLLIDRRRRDMLLLGIEFEIKKASQQPHIQLQRRRTLGY